MRIRWTAAAAADLEHISTNLKDRYPHYRQPTIRRLREAIHSLKESPTVAVSDAWTEPESTALKSAVYRVNEQGIEMLRIYHAAQDRP